MERHLTVTTHKHIKPNRLKKIRTDHASRVHLGQQVFWFLLVFPFWPLCAFISVIQLLTVVCTMILCQQESTSIELQSESRFICLKWLQTEWCSSAIVHQIWTVCVQYWFCKAEVRHRWYIHGLFHPNGGSIWHTSSGFWFTLISILQFYKRSNGSVQIGSMCTIFTSETFHFWKKTSAFLMVSTGMQISHFIILKNLQSTLAPKTLWQLFIKSISFAKKYLKTIF